MWITDERFIRQNRFTAIAGIWAIFLGTSALAIFGVGIGYAVIIGHATGIIASVLVFQRYDVLCTHLHFLMSGIAAHRENQGYSCS
jgi:type IV secretory pathway VirB3-like protein